MPWLAHARANRVHPSYPLLHIEDDFLWRELIVSVVETSPVVQSCLSASTGAEGMSLAQAHQPALVLLDLFLPDMDGFAIARELAQLPRPPRVLALSNRTDDETLYQVGQSHFAGLIWKNVDALHLLPIALAEIVAGQKYYSPDVRDAFRRLRSDPKAFFKILSMREVELLPYFGLGWSDGEIADHLGASAFTIKSHRQHILAKLDLHRTAQLIHWTIVHGFVPANGLPPPRPKSEEPTS
jgi:DNA-binding NarL/FixJ family response regulator